MSTATAALKAAQVFQQLDEEGLGFIDVGARGGIHHPAFQEAGGLLRVVGFEADPQACKQLNDLHRPKHPFKSLRYLPYALGDADGQRFLHQCRSGGNSSFHRPNRSFLDRFPNPGRFDVTETITVPVRALDQLLKAEAPSFPPHLDFIKIDTQGSELEVLQGARGLLREQILGVEIEVEFNRQYESQPLFRDVDAWLSECGFTLFKLRRLEWVRQNFERQAHLTAGQLVFGDALYLKDPLMHPQPETILRTPRRAQALMLIATLYDLHDFALEIASHPVTAALFDARATQRYILARSRRLAPPLGRIHGFLRGLKAYRESHGDLKQLLPWLHRYDRSCARPDLDFYTRLK